MKKLFLCISAVICTITPYLTTCMQNNTCPASPASSIIPLHHNYALIPYPQNALVPYPQKTYVGSTHHQQKRRTEQTTKKLTANGKARMLSDKINKHVFGNNNSNNLADKLSRSIVDNYTDEEFIKEMEIIDEYIKTVNDDNAIRFLAKKNRFFDAIVEHICRINSIRFTVTSALHFNDDINKILDLSPIFNRYIAEQIITSEYIEYKTLDEALQDFAAKREADAQFNAEI